MTATYRHPSSNSSLVLTDSSGTSLSTMTSPKAICQPHMLGHSGGAMGDSFHLEFNSKKRSQFGFKANVVSWGMQSRVIIWLLSQNVLLIWITDPEKCRKKTSLEPSGKPRCSMSALMWVDQCASMPSPNATNYTDGIDLSRLQALRRFEGGDTTVQTAKMHSARSRS